LGSAFHGLAPEATSRRPWRGLDLCASQLEPIRMCGRQVLTHELCATAYLDEAVHGRVGSG